MNFGAIYDDVNLPLVMAIQKVIKYIVIKQSEWQENKLQTNFYTKSVKGLKMQTLEIGGK